MLLLSPSYYILHAVSCWDFVLHIFLEWCLFHYIFLQEKILKKKLNFTFVVDKPEFLLSIFPKLYVPKLLCTKDKAKFMCVLNYCFFFWNVCTDWLYNVSLYEDFVIYFYFHISITRQHDVRMAPLQFPLVQVQVQVAAGTSQDNTFFIQVYNNNN